MTSIIPEGERGRLVGVPEEELGHDGVVAEGVFGNGDTLVIRAAKDVWSEPCVILSRRVSVVGCESKTGGVDRNQVYCRVEVGSDGQLILKPFEVHLMRMRVSAFASLETHRVNAEGNVALISVVEVSEQMSSVLIGTDFATGCFPDSVDFSGLAGVLLKDYAQAEMTLS